MTNKIQLPIRGIFDIRKKDGPAHIRIVMLNLKVKETHTISIKYEQTQTTDNKLINQYMLIKELGRGVHGKVKLGKDLETGELVAIKIVERITRRRLGQHNNDLTNEQKIRREISILKKCIHPHVVRLKEVIDDPTSKKIYMVIEYMEGGEIKWKDENDNPLMTINEARQTFRDVVLGLEYPNLLLTADHVVKISDFGVSHFNDTDLAKTAGSPAFFAPELCCTDKSRPPITKAIDVWALGVTLYCFIFGKCPFIADTEFELFFRVIPHQPLQFPENISISADLKDLLKSLLEKDPLKRITLDEVKKHPWVTADIPDPEKWREETDTRKYQLSRSTSLTQIPTAVIVDRVR
ncbi:5224_t:CDS:2 [Entrophospora sp. SA101]|nr:2295_t:CDS:2 [Entrophospora sp. SA101]CAJ0887716.1 5224_t:CDS:2 [Entrophospora sp. SA101]CAJ0918448.1 10121_t:CDS:2 [Entrophospora sp. SA101]